MSDADLRWQVEDSFLERDPHTVLYTVNYTGLQLKISAAIEHSTNRTRMFMIELADDEKEGARFADGSPPAAEATILLPLQGHRSVVGIVDMTGLKLVLECSHEKHGETQHNSREHPLVLRLSKDVRNRDNCLRRAYCGCCEHGCGDCANCRWGDCTHQAPTSV